MIAELTGNMMLNTERVWQLADVCASRRVSSPSCMCNLRACFRSLVYENVDLYLVVRRCVEFGDIVLRYCTIGYFAI